MTFLVHINDHAYAVANEDVWGVEARIVEAVRAGGAFVDVRGDGRPVRVLVTPASPVRIEEVVSVVLADDSGDAMLELTYLELDL